MSEAKEDPLQVVLTIQCDEERPYFEFVERMREIGLVSKYQLAQVTSPAIFFRTEFVEYIAEHGLHSLFKLQLVMEDITSPSMAIDEVETVVAKFVRTLLPAKRLVIVDPYFYKPGSDTDAFVARLLGQQAATLEQVFIFSNGSGSMKSQMHAAFATVAPKVAVFDTSTDAFHDRFWINPDEGTGIVMGTSLNGLGKKIALVDKLSRSDVQDVMVEARKLNSSI